MKSKFKTLIAATVLLGSISTPVFAKNHISSNVWKETSSGQYRSCGWVNILDDNGEGVSHYTTARLENQSGKTIYETSSRVWGTGKASAQTKYNPNNGYARVYYGY